MLGMIFTPVDRSLSHIPEIISDLACFTLSRGWFTHQISFHEETPRQCQARHRRGASRRLSIQLRTLNLAGPGKLTTTRRHPSQTLGFYPGYQRVFAAVDGGERMVAQVERIITIAEALIRAQRIVKQLRTTGNGEAAALIERECKALSKQIVSRAKGRRRNGIRARKQLRNGSGRFQ